MHWWILPIGLLLVLVYGYLAALLYVHRKVNTSKQFGGDIQ